MVGSKLPLGGLGLLFTSGALVLLFFIILSGVSNVTPFKNTYFLQADTSGITGAKDITRWTYFYMCDENNLNCAGPWPAPPFGYAWSGGASGVPDGLAGPHGRDTTSKFYFYMWRFGWVFYMISLFFVAMAWFASFLACCGRLGSAIAALVAATGLFFLTIAVSLMTCVQAFLTDNLPNVRPPANVSSATFVKARDAFLAAGRDASVGRYAFGFGWGAWAALLIATVLFGLGIRSDRSGGGGGGRSWRRRKSTRSRRSYDVGSRRVKDDYS
ncbi:SUR7/PalI family-domain-containing protein [Plectosphaerella cucumerina]|uniref:SUR7/PalI family-domain-containing protein n=1 Tax=Plectosphaerella cucumerina TaxID=40658 RepID=A0A8K0TRD9_9PEZI|nr:SUR7/PalI family-domain-containing protein [Plectosphaerella cucumerina]